MVKKNAEKGMRSFGVIIYEWHTFSLRIQGKRKTFSKLGKKTFFFNGYFRHLYTRPSCENCTYKLGNRLSDITISDCWGYHIIAPELDDNKGMSSVVCHSNKGVELFESIKDELIWKETKFEDVQKYNAGYFASAPKSDLREEFWEDYKSLDKKRLFKKYCKPDHINIRDVIKEIIYKALLVIKK